MAVRRYDDTVQGRTMTRYYSQAGSSVASVEYDTLATLARELAEAVQRNHRPGSDGYYAGEQRLAQAILQALE